MPNPILATEDVNEKRPPVAKPEASEGNREPATEFSLTGPAGTSSFEPNYTESIDFLRRFHPNRRWVLTAISLDKRNLATATFSEQDADRCRRWLESNGASRNIYFSVGEVVRDVEKKAERTDISKVWWFHVDLDPRAGEDIAQEQARCLGLLQSPKDLPPPTVIVHSGGGYQGFWALNAPLAIDCDLDKAEDAKRYNLKIELTLAADNVHDISRIMRLPGTLNRPDERKAAKGRKLALAHLIEWNEDRVYSIDRFAKAPAVSGGGASATIGTRPAAQVDVGSVVRFASLDDPAFAKVSNKAKVVIAQGHDPDEPNKFQGRSEWLYYACCEMVRGGCDDQTIYAVITDPEWKVSVSVLDKGSYIHAYATRQISRARAESVEPELAELNAKHFVIENWGGKCRVAQEVWDDSLSRARLTKQSFDDFRNRYMNRVMQIGQSDKGPITKPLGQWWLGHRNRQSYERLIFAPGRSVPADTYNLWRGFGCEARLGDCGLFLQHLRDNICGGNLANYEYLLGWMARAVQQPGEPGQVAVVLRGQQGTGKSFFVKMFGSLFGRHYLRISDMKHLVGSFNAHLQDVVLLFADEAFYAGDKKSRGLLKSLVTDETLAIEGKGQDVELSRNCVHLVMASNDKWVVPAEVDDRRFFVLDVGNGHACDSRYFRAIAQQMDNGGREALLHMLQARDLSEFEVRTRPVTEGLRDQKVLSIDPATEWVLVLLEDGTLPSAAAERPNCAYSNDIGGTGTGLFSDARQRIPKLRHESDHALGAMLREWGAKPWKNRSRGWAFPPLPELRALWETKYGPREWAGGAVADWRTPPVAGNGAF